MRHAADPADRDNKSDQTGKQQPGTALDRRQDADSENSAHSDPNRESTKQFHGAHPTCLRRRFKPSVSRNARSISVRLISTGLERVGSLKDIFRAPMPRILKLSNAPSGGADTRMVESNQDSTCGWGESVFLPLNLRLAADLT